MKYLITALTVGLITLTLADEPNSISDWCSSVEVYPTSFFEQVQKIGNVVSIGGYISCTSDDPSNQSITLTIEGPADTWFGIIFEGSPVQDALIYTTGKIGTDSPQFYDYTVIHSDDDKSTEKVTKKQKQDWTLVGTLSTRNDMVSGSYKRQLSTLKNVREQTSSSANANERKIAGRYVVGRNKKMMISDELAGSGGSFEMSFTTILEQGQEQMGRILSGSARAGASGSDWCSGLAVYPTNYSVPLNGLGDGISIGGIVNCLTSAPETQTITLTIVGPSTKWFGIPFGSSMINDAVVFTTGKNGTDTLQLYDYWNTDRSLSDVHKDTEQDWIQNNMTISNGVVTLVYTRLLVTEDNQDRAFTGNHKTLTVMYAISGQGTHLSKQHQISSLQVFQLNFGTGSISSYTSAVVIIRRWHGGIMWFAWNLFAYTGVICARYKTLLFKKQERPPDRWFIAHSWCMRTAALLTFVGFILGVIAVKKAGTPHFSKAHFVVGLIIFILAMIQPINAAIRPHKEEGPVQPTRRVVWEFIHKNSGRTAVALSIFNVFSGMALLGVSKVIIGLQIAYIVTFALVVIALEIKWFLNTRTKGN